MSVSYTTRQNEAGQWQAVILDARARTALSVVTLDSADEAEAATLEAVEEGWLEFPDGYAVKPEAEAASEPAKKLAKKPAKKSTKG